MAFKPARSERCNPGASYGARYVALQVRRAWRRYSFPLVLYGEDGRPLDRSMDHHFRVTCELSPRFEAASCVEERHTGPASSACVVTIRKMQDLQGPRPFHQSSTCHCRHSQDRHKSYIHTECFNESMRHAQHASRVMYSTPQINAATGAESGEGIRGRTPQGS